MCRASQQGSSWLTSWARPDRPGGGTSEHASGPDPIEPTKAPVTAEHVRRFGPAALIAIVAILFVFQNTDRVKFEFLWLDFEWPMWIMLVVFGCVGAAILYGLQRRQRRRSRRSDDE